MEELQDSEKTSETIMKQELQGYFDGNINISSKQEDSSYIIEVDNETYKVENDKVEYLGPGIRNKENVLVDSKNKILFLKTITKEDIKSDFPNYKNFEVIGISTEENGEFITTGSLEGKTGSLEIVGNITDLTFEYKLSKVMLGDENFFVKVKIDDEEKIQKLTVKQGEVVYYEENLLEYAIDRTEWFDIEGDTWSGGKGKKAIVTPDGDLAQASFEFKGSKCELLWGQTQMDSGILAYQVYDESDTAIASRIKALDASEENCYSLNMKDGLNTEQTYTMKLMLTYNSIFDHYKTGYSSLVIDGIRIWK